MDQALEVWTKHSHALLAYRFSFHRLQTFLTLNANIPFILQVLVKLRGTILPLMPSPILLSDFLTDSYNLGGVVSVMSLDGLYTLITQHGLEYPDFYNKLYALLEPSIFLAKYRARFFEVRATSSAASDGICMVCCLCLTRAAWFVVHALVLKRWKVNKRNHL